MYICMYESSGHYFVVRTEFLYWGTFKACTCNFILCSGIEILRSTNNSDLENTYYSRSPAYRSYVQEE